MPSYALVTGSSGAIGAAICKKFKNSGYLTCGIDVVQNSSVELDCFIKVDLNLLVINEAIRTDVYDQIKNWLGAGNTLDVLINNAAHQYVSLDHPIPVEQLTRSHNINVLAPYLLVTGLAELFTHESGSVVNIGSIHRQLTKPGFIAYATTKAAIASLTKGLAIDYENQFRVNCIEPASVETPMLTDGFSNHPENKKQLENYHPQKRICTPKEIAELVFAICSPTVMFLHGSCIDMSGGIASRLHDPS